MSRENGFSHEVGRDAGADGEDVGDGGCRHEHLSRSLSYVGDGRRHESQDDERDEEAQKLAEEGVEGYEKTSEPYGKELTAKDTQHDGYQNLYEKVDTKLEFHGLRLIDVWDVEDLFRCV